MPRSKWPLLAVCLYATFHLLMLSRSPIPYFDDTFFASISHTFTQTGEMRLSVSPLWMSGPVYLYGPIYFYAQRLVYEVLGFGILQSRILGLGFGIGVIFVVYAIFRQAGLSKTLGFWATVLLALDPTMVLSMHSGRMDGMALFLILVSFLLLQKTWDGGTIWLAVASGTFAAAGVLTTPRPAYLVALIGLVLVVRWCLERSWLRLWQAVAWGLPIVVLYSAWIWYAFGSLSNLRQYYAGFAGDYVGGRFSIRPVHYPILAALAITAIIRLRKDVLRFDELVFFSLTGILTFYALGINPPQYGTVYTIFIIPLLYTALAGMMVAPRSSYMTAGLVLLLFNSAALCARTGLEILQWGSRDPRAVEDVVKTVIPPGSKVVGDDKFYFAVMNSGSDFQYTERGGTLEERIAYLDGTYGFDYFITSNDEAVRPYMATIPLVRIAMIGPSAESGALAEWISNIARALRVGKPLEAGYEGSIYVRGRFVDDVDANASMVTRSAVVE